MRRISSRLLRCVGGALVLLVLPPLYAAVASAHGGGLDAQGCHQDRKAGVYHCHRGPLAGQTFANKQEAAKALGQSPAAPRKASAAYDRSLYGGWIDADGDCQDTRQEVLIEESRIPVTLTPDGCRVLKGEWNDPYTGKLFTDPRQLDIDHLVPLAEVHRSGGSAWSPVQRRSYANDLLHAETLIAVSAAANRSKGDKDPAQWMPPNAVFACAYLVMWNQIKATWHLDKDQEEAAAIAQRLAYCPPAPQPNNQPVRATP